LELNVDPSLRSRLHDESGEGSWNPETDSMISCQLLEQIEEEDELEDDCDITESEDDFDHEEAQDAFAKIMGKDNAVFQLEKFRYQQGRDARGVKLKKIKGKLLVVVHEVCWLKNLTFRLKEVGFVRKRGVIYCLELSVFL
jgi:hypothetical protein